MSKNFVSLEGDASASGGQFGSAGTISSTTVIHVADAQPGACMCPACTAGAFGGASDSVDASVDYLAGSTAANGKQIWTVDQITAHLNRTGASWVGGPDPAPQRGDNGQGVITYGFFATQGEVANNGYVYYVGTSGYGLNEYFNFRPFTDAQRAATREAMTYWDDLVAVSFQETAVGEADINFGGIQAPSTQAYARLPFGTLSNNATVNAQVQPIAGDVWVSVDQASNFMLDEGGYGIHTLVHEIGHGLGLSHPGAYNAAPGLSITYGANAEYYQDARNYTVMSYFNVSSIGARHFDFHTSTTAYASTPMIHDIAAIQAMYGADTATRTGDTTYGFNSNAGRDAYDFTLTLAPVMTIYDAGGDDTLDASGYATNQIIDLREGSLSSIGGVTYDTAPSFEQVNANRAAAGMSPVSQATYDANMAVLKANPIVGVLTDNVGIAYGTIIENAVGGSGNDLMVGNQVANKLVGNAGNDTFVGGDGTDWFTGGEGSDTFFAQINDTAKLAGKKGAISVDIVTDFKTGVDKIDLGLIDANTKLDGQQGFVMVAEPTKAAGQLWTVTYGNVNALENALGITLPGFTGSKTGSGNVTVVFGDVDGGGADFAFVLLGTQSVAMGDFINLGGEFGAEGTISSALSSVLAASGGVSGAAAAANADALPFAANDLFAAEDGMDDLIVAALGQSLPGSVADGVSSGAFVPVGDIAGRFGFAFGLHDGGRSAVDDLMHVQIAA